MHDIFIIGGGINGCGTARDAAGRGLSVFLAEKSDLACGTSSASTKLIHGGLRYLERYEFRLVRESLKERETLLRMAPHIVRPMRFVLPHHAGLRPRPLLRLGLFVYDHLGGRSVLAGSRAVDLGRDPLGAPLKPEFQSAFEYSDCWVDDARLVVLNAMDARSRGAIVRTRTEVVSARREERHWRVTIRDADDGAREDVLAKTIVNAAGPWVSEVASRRLNLDAPFRTRLVRGSHIVVGRLFDHDRAYVFQNRDGRIVFAIPYEDEFTLIGTTDVDVGADPNAATIGEDEISYLLEASGEYFSRKIARSDVIWTYSGIRPLFDDGERAAQRVTRDYVLSVDAPRGAAPALGVFGGKITTYRRLAEEALARLSDWIPAMPPPWTAGTVLPGGRIAGTRTDGLAAEIHAAFPDLTERQTRRYARTYGTCALDWLDGVERIGDLGEDFGAGLFAREVRHLMRREWARTAEDVLWRRTKLGLELKRDQVDRLEAWMRRNGPAATDGEGES